MDQGQQQHQIKTSKYGYGEKDKILKNGQNENMIEDDVTQAQLKMTYNIIFVSIAPISKLFIPTWQYFWAFRRHPLYPSRKKMLYPWPWGVGHR